MNVGSLGPGATGARPAAPPHEPLTRARAVGLETIARAFAGAAVAAAVALVAPNAPAYARALAYGARILDRHEFGTALGTEVFGGVGSPAGAFGWFPAALLALAVRALGPDAGYVFAVLAAAGALAFVAAAARLRASGTIAAGAALLALIASLDALRVGGSGFAWCAAAAFLYAGARAREAEEARAAYRWSALAIAAAIVWCNASPYGIAAAPLALADALAATFRSGAGSVAARRAWLIAAGCGLALLLNPAPFAYPVLAFANLDLDRVSAGPLAVHPADVAPLGYKTGFVAIAILLALLGVPRERRASDAWRACAALGLALCNGALIPLFAFVAAPPLAAAVAEAFGRGARRESERARGAATAAAWVAGALVAIAACSGPRESALLARAAVPASADVFARTLQRDGRVHRLVCEKVERCADVVALGDPKLRVFVDDRAVAAPAGIRKIQSDFSTLRGAWLGALPRRVDALAVESGGHVDSVLKLERGWTRLGSDDRIAVYERAAESAR